MGFCCILVLHNNSIFLSISIGIEPEESAPSVAIDIKSKFHFRDILIGTYFMSYLSHYAFCMSCTGLFDELKFYTFRKAVVDDEGRSQLIDIIASNGFFFYKKDVKFMFFLLH